MPNNERRTNLQRFFGAVGGVALSVMGSCGGDAEDTGASDAPAERPRDVRPLAQIRVELPAVERNSRASDRAGLVVALLDLGWTDLEGVVPHVGAAPIAPGLREVVGVGAEDWVARVEVDLDPWEVRLALCPPERTCARLASRAGTFETPWEATSELLRASSTVLARFPTPESYASWSAPISADPYAVLIAGRSAAVVYGLRDPSAPEHLGDFRIDPVARAVRIDPGMGVADWLLARREVERGEVLAARKWLGRGVLARPASVALRADEAALQLADGDVAEAARAFEALGVGHPADLRLLAPTARSLLGAGRVEDAARVLSGFRAEIHRDPVVAELRVALAEAGAPPDDYDRLLAVWQDSAPTLAEPVRRRIRLRVRDGEYGPALDRVPDFAGRGADDEARRLTLALATALERWEDAAVAAEGLDRPDVAGRLRARAALIAEPTRVPPQLAVDRSPDALVAAGRARLRAGDVAGAFADADAALQIDPWRADALELSLAAAADAGGALAEQRRGQLAAVAPYGAFVVVSPNTAAGATGRRSQVQASSGP